MSEWWEKGYPGGSPVGPATLVRPLYAPGNRSNKMPSEDGPDVVAIKRAVSRLGRWPWQTFDDAFSPAFARGKSGNVRDTGLAGVQRQQRIEPTGNLGNETYQALRYAHIPAELAHAGEPAFDEVAIELLEEAALSVAWGVELGPMFAGGKSVLQHDLTHATGGIDLYPAFDDAFVEGKTIIAPELLTVTRASSSNPGDACYADGTSGLRYWIGHLVEAPAEGRIIYKGYTVGYVCHNEVGGGPHVHVGVNVERLWSSGAELEHHTNYTHGAPTIGAQLEAGPPL